MADAPLIAVLGALGGSLVTGVASLVRTHLRHGALRTGRLSDAFCLAVDWKHNPGMAYLDLKLEERCLYARQLLLEWLSTPHVTVGDTAYVRKSGAEEDDLTLVPLSTLRKMRRPDYAELRVERRPIVVLDAADLRRIRSIKRALSSVIAGLKAVIAY